MMFLPFNNTRRVVVSGERPRRYRTLLHGAVLRTDQIGMRIGTDFMDTNTEQLSWYALQVVTKKETQVASALSQKGYECFLPVYKKRSVWSDRNKTLSVPLFSGYVFSRFNVQRRMPILVTPNVRAVIGNGKVPVPVAEDDLNAIRVALQNGLPIEPYDNLQNGDVVLVTKGPLAGIEGSFVQYRGTSRLVLSVSLINRAVAVEMDRLCVEPVHQRTITKTNT
jgi:transcription antitermination factor NusG